MGVRFLNLNLVLAQEFLTVEKRACYHTDFFLGIESVSLFFDKQICW